MAKRKPKKPFKGEVHGWYRKPIPVTALIERGLLEPGEGGLGYVIVGDVFNHPKFGTSFGFRTSWVEKHNEETGEIETRNSRYKLVGPERQS